MDVSQVVVHDVTTDDEPYMVTGRYPIGGDPSMLNIVDGEPSRRLKTKSTKSVIQAILDSLPPRIFGPLPQERRVQLATALEAASTIKALLACIVGVQVENCQKQFDRSLVTLDAQHYHRRWICPACNQRWGRHNPNTLACPDLNPLSRSELE